MCATVSAAVVVDRLVKDYGAARAVDGVSFEVDRGEVFALLGPNGAGKSSIVEILEGHRERTSGTVRVLDTDPATAGSDSDFRERIGIVLQSSGIDPELTVREAVDFYGAAYRRPAATDELIELVELQDKADSRVSTLSGGQQRRIDLALGLVGDPEVVFLDEPTTGFDPAARRRGWELVERLASQQRAVILTTHYLDEAEALADRVAVLAKGRIVAEGTPAQLRARAGSALISFVLPDHLDTAADLLSPLKGEIVGRQRSVQITTDEPTADLAHLTGWAQQRGLELEGLTVTKPSLEDVYLALVADDADPLHPADSPGQAVEAPDKANNAPLRAGEPSVRADEAPSQTGEAPEKAGESPEQSALDTGDEGDEDADAEDGSDGAP